MDSINRNLMTMQREYQDYSYFGDYLFGPEGEKRFQAVKKIFES